MRQLHHVLLPLILLSATTWVHGSEVSVDLLLGCGDFETASALTRWDTSYTGTDIDWNSPDLWLYQGSHSGYRLPLPNGVLGTLWRIATNENVNPFTNAEYRLAPGGISGSQCQYVGLKDVTGYGQAILLTRIPLNRPGTSVHGGDTVVFQIDHIRMVNYEGVNASYAVRVRPSTDVSTWTSSTFQPSSTPFSTHLTATLPASPEMLTVEVMIAASGTGGHTPGMYIDGAHVFVRPRGGSEYETREVPVPRNRSIKTFKLYYNRSILEEYSAALDYDYLVISNGNSLDSIPALRAANPSAKLYMYQTSMVYKRDFDNKDEYYWNSPVGYRYMTSTHPEHLYENGAGGYVANQDYPDTYYARLGSPGYQTLWVAKVIEKLGGAHLDGIWVDDIVDLDRMPSGDSVPILRPQLALWETQGFMHKVVPLLRAAGLDVVQNAILPLTEGRGSVYFDPFWAPSPPYDPPQYEGNTPSNTASPAKEWSFFRMEGFYRDGNLTNYRRNVYDRAYWKQCLDDMAKAKEWNEAGGVRALPDDRKRRLWMLVLGVDNPDDPAYGTDGWLQFGLCSYLLGQNDWTIYGCGLRIDYSANVDFSITKRLGEPDGDHSAIGDDEYFRFRRYKPSVGGAAGGVVVVNANTDSSRIFALDFDGTDEEGNVVTTGQQVTIKPHTGRIFLKQKGPVFVRIRTPSSAVAPGDMVTVTVDFLNSSTSDALGVTLRAAVPSSMTYVPGSAELSGGSYDPATNSVRWKIGTVAAGQSGRRTFTAAVK